MAKSFFPLYMEVAGQIREQIEKGAFQGMEKLPYESWLMEHYQVSRVTIRKALDHLISQGVLERRAYHGVYIRKNNFSVIHDNTHFHSFSFGEEETQISHSIISFTTERAEDSNCSPLGCAGEDEVYHLKVLRKNNDEVFVSQEIFLKVSLLPKLDIYLLRDHLLHDIIENIYGMKISHISNVIGVDHPSEEECRYLGAKPNDSLLRVKDTMVLEDGVPVCYGVSLYAKNVDYKFVVYNV